MSDASRTVVVGPTVSRASADYETYNISTAVESGKDICLPYATTLTPYVGIDYIHSKRSDFTETGTGAANLNISDQDQDSLRTKVGFRLAHEINAQTISRIFPYTTIAYVREHMDSVIHMNAGFATVPTTSFRVSGSKLDRDRLRVGLGVTGQLNEKTTLNIGYFGELADSHDIHSISTSVRVLW
jgi:outer membrane autotransporter protein